MYSFELETQKAKNMRQLLSMVPKSCNSMSLKDMWNKGLINNKRMSFIKCAIKNLPVIPKTLKHTSKTKIKNKEKIQILIKTRIQMTRTMVIYHQSGPRTSIHGDQITKSWFGSRSIHLLISHFLNTIPPIRKTWTFSRKMTRKNTWNRMRETRLL